MLNPVLRAAAREDLPDLARFIQAYYRLEGIPFDLFRLERGLVPLLERPDLGRVWMIDLNNAPIGYFILCFGYSIEKGGRDAMVDEFFIDAAWRKRGIGRQVLELVIAEARAIGLVSVFLEVRRDNDAAQRLYTAAGFTLRDKYLLMDVDST
ncbi:MAG: GNAT family N-acetyltransferase [Gammaproteobacteria bacterium]|nr:GNAT family N-acetyltransferase [Gammaproteobacteria bacterium]